MVEEKPMSVGELEDLINKEMGELNVITNILDKKKSKFNELNEEIYSSNINMRPPTHSKRDSRIPLSRKEDKENQASASKERHGFGSSSSRKLNLLEANTKFKQKAEESRSRAKLVSIDLNQNNFASNILARNAVFSKENLKKIESEENFEKANFSNQALQNNSKEVSPQTVDET